MKNLLKRGLGTKTKQAEPIMPEDEQIIWEKGVFGHETEEKLQCTMFFYNCKLFGLRGHEEHHDLDCAIYYGSGYTREIRRILWEIDQDVQRWIGTAGIGQKTSATTVNPVSELI